MQRRRQGEDDRSPGEPTVEARIERAALEVSAEVGYWQLTVEAIIVRAAVSRNAFYQRYPNKTECFASAYAGEVDSLAARLLERCREGGGWKEGLSAVLADLAGFAIADPLLANALFTQAFLADAVVGEKRAEVLQRLTAPMDRARLESSFSPPPIAAPFVISAIEGALTGALGRGAPEEFAEALPALRYIAVATYFGAEEAQAEMDAGR